MDIFALTTRGLESLSADEMRALPDLSVQQIAYRRVEAEYSGDLAALCALRAVDDVFLTLAAWDGISHERAMLSRFVEWSAALRPADSLPLLATLRILPEEPAFSVTVNFVGKRNYSAPEVKAVLAESLVGQNPGWRYAEDDAEADLNLRLFIEHETALVGLRIARDPLHRRAYKVANLPGALKPTVAAAMLQLAGVTKRSRLVDPFCGSGTILIEAALRGATAIGGDLDLEALEAARINVQQAGVRATLCQWDGRHLPLSEDAVSCVVANLPWGRQIPVDVGLERLYQHSFVEMQHRVIPSGKIVLLTTHPDLIGRSPQQSIEISLYGQTPQILVFSV